MFNNKRKIAILSDSENLFTIINESFNKDKVYKFESKSLEKLEHYSDRYDIIFIDLVITHAGKIGYNIFLTGFQGDILYVNKKEPNGLDKRYENVINETDLTPDAIPDVNIDTQIANTVFLKRRKV